MSPRRSPTAASCWAESSRPERHRCRRALSSPCRNDYIAINDCVKRAVPWRASPFEPSKIVSKADSAFVPRGTGDRWRTRRAKFCAWRWSSGNGRRQTCSTRSAVASRRLAVLILRFTNALSEALRRAPAGSVARWMAARPVESLFTMEEEFAGRILPFDRAAARAFAEIAAVRRRSGWPLGGFAAQIAAIARSRGATVATRNIDDFVGCGIAVVSPWT